MPPPPPPRPLRVKAWELSLWFNKTKSEIEHNLAVILREAAKKKVPPPIARPLRGGGGKGRAITEKLTFFETFFFILLPFKNKIILL